MDVPRLKTVGDLLVLCLKGDPGGLPYVGLKSSHADWDSEKTGDLDIPSTTLSSLNSAVDILWLREHDRPKEMPVVSPGHRRVYCVTSPFGSFPVGRGGLRSSFG